MHNDEFLAVVAVERYALARERYPDDQGQLGQPKGRALEEVASGDRAQATRGQEREIGERDRDTGHWGLLAMSGPDRPGCGRADVSLSVFGAIVVTGSREQRIRLR